jgi:hypothetical protein
MTNSDLKAGDRVSGRFQNVDIPFTVTQIETGGPKVWLKHDAGEVHVRKQDIKDKVFELEVKPRT